MSKRERERKGGRKREKEGERERITIQLTCSPIRTNSNPVCEVFPGSWVAHENVLRMHLLALWMSRSVAAMSIKPDQHEPGDQRKKTN